MHLHSQFLDLIIDLLGIAGVSRVTVGSGK